MYQLQGRYLQNQVMLYFTFSNVLDDDLKVNNGLNTVIQMNVELKMCCGLQGIIWPQVITGAVGNVLNAIINYVFLFRLDLGVA